MAQTPIIAELHGIREAHAKRFGYDLNAIFADLRRRQAQRQNLSKLPPVKPLVAGMAEESAPYGTLRPAKKRKREVPE